MSALTRSIPACPCGKPHICPISAVEIGEGALSSIPALCAGFTRILLVADENTYAAAGARVEAALSGKQVERVIFGGEILIPDEAAIEKAKQRIRLL